MCDGKPDVVMGEHLQKPTALWMVFLTLLVCPQLVTTQNTVQVISFGHTFLSAELSGRECGGGVEDEGALLLNKYARQ